MTSTLVQHDVFVSYSRKDIAFAKILHDAMKSRGLDTWIDWEDIPPSVDWLAEVYRAIESAHTFVFVVSQSSVDSEVCHREIEHALKHNKRIIPITVHDIDPSAVPPEVAALNWIFFREQDEFQRSFDVLLDAIQTDMDWVRVHTRLLQRALEWQEQGNDPSFLLRGAELASSLEAIAGAGTGKEPRLTQLQVDYVQESQRYETEQERRWKRRSQLIRGLITGALVVSSALTAWALANAREARLQQRQSRSNELAAFARMMLDQDPAASFRLAEAALDVYPGRMAQSILWASLEDPFATLMLEGHTERVSQAVYSPDQRKIATASWDGTVRVWDAATGRQERMLVSREGHKVKTVGSVSFSPDGETLISMTRYCGLAGGDRACVWDVTTGKLLYTLAHDDMGTPPVISPDGRYVVALPPSDKWKPGRYDVPVFDFATGRKSFVLEGHTDIVDRAAFSPRGDLLATDSTEEGALRIWDMRTRKALHVFAGQKGHSRFLAWSPDGRMLALTSVNGTVRLYDAKSGNLVFEHVTREAAGYAVFSPDGSRIAVKVEPDRVVVLDLRSRKVANQFRKLPEIGSTLSDQADIAFSPDGALLACASDKGRVVIREVQSGETLFTLKGHVLPVNSVTFSRDGRSVLTASSDGTARVWALQAGQEIDVIRCSGGHEGNTSFSVSRDGRLALIIYDKQSCEAWDLEEHVRLWMTNEEPGSVVGAALSPDGSVALIATSDGLINVRDAKTGDQVCVIGSPGSVPSRVVFCSQGGVVGTVALDDSAVLWDLTTGRRLLRYTHRPTEEVTDVAFAPDGQRAVSVGRSYIHVWEVRSGKPLMKIKNTANAYHVWFTPDGEHVLTTSLGVPGVSMLDIQSGEQVWRLKDSTLLSVSADGSLALTSEAGRLVCVRIETGETVAELIPVAEAVSACFSPSGELVACGCENGTVQMWDVADGDMIARYTGHEGSTWGVTFVGTGERLASWSMDGTIRTWPVTLGEMLRLLDTGFRAAPRSLSKRELQEYGLVGK